MKLCIFIREEGREADYVLKATIDLDLKSMEDFWNEAKDHNYSFLGNNSSDAVIKVLEAGNDDFYLISQAFGPTTRKPNPNWTQTDYIIWIREKLTNFRLQGIQHGLRRKWYIFFNIERNVNGISLFDVRNSMLSLIVFCVQRIGNTNLCGKWTLTVLKDKWTFKKELNRGMFRKRTKFREENQNIKGRMIDFKQQIYTDKKDVKVLLLVCT